jgi:hypothetical protein
MNQDGKRVVESTTAPVYCGFCPDDKKCKKCPIGGENEE